MKVCRVSRECRLQFRELDSVVFQFFGVNPRGYYSPQKKEKQTAAKYEKPVAEPTSNILGQVISEETNNA